MKVSAIAAIAALSLLLPEAVIATESGDNIISTVKDKMRSCLDAAGNKVSLDDDFTVCTYTTTAAGAFEGKCKATYGPEDAACPEKKIKRDSSSPEVVNYWSNIFVDISLVPKYRLSVSPIGEKGKSNNDCAVCRESFRTPPLKGNCGLLEPTDLMSSPTTGRLGCNEMDCQAAVCEIDDFCCGNFSGWWDRICIGYAGSTPECFVECDSDFHSRD